MKKIRPHVLTIAGFDPSNGAGLTADIKTMEALKCYGVSVCTANTIQNDTTFKACNWIPAEVIKAQLELLLVRFKIHFVKIGIVENWSILNELIETLLQYNPNIKIIVDPVLKSSSNFIFHQQSVLDKTEQRKFEGILSKIYLLTPNYEEIQNLYQGKTNAETIQHIRSKTNLLLKGGHREEAIGTDELFMRNGKGGIFRPMMERITEKHGSGCVLSSAIVSYLALGSNLSEACNQGKRYTEKLLSSNETLLGYH